jgi:hypothetical protein
MTQPAPFRWFKTSPEIIRLAVMLYVRFSLSLRNFENLLHERGIDVSHEAVRYWWHRFGPMFALHLGARALIEMKERHGIGEVFTGIRAGNGPAEKLCAKLGLRATDFEILLAIAPDVLGAERVTK